MLRCIEQTKNGPPDKWFSTIIFNIRVDKLVCGWYRFFVVAFDKSGNKFLLHIVKPWTRTFKPLNLETLNIIFIILILWIHLNINLEFDELYAVFGYPLYTYWKARLKLHMHIYAYVNNTLNKIIYIYDFIQFIQLINKIIKCNDDEILTNTDNKHHNRQFKKEILSRF